MNRQKLLEVAEEVGLIGPKSRVGGTHEALNRFIDHVLAQQVTLPVEVKVEFSKEHAEKLLHQVLNNYLDRFVPEGRLHDRMLAFAQLIPNLAAVVSTEYIKAQGDNPLMALDTAVSAIYFADSSKYLGALWNVVRYLDPQVAADLELDEPKTFTRVKAAAIKSEASKK